MIRERLARLAWIFSEKFGLILLSMLSFFVFAHLLSPEELGLGVLIIVIVELVALLFSSLIEDPLVRQRRISPVQRATAFWACLLAGLGSAALIGAAGLLIDPRPEIRTMVLAAALKVPLTLMARIYVAEMRRTGNFRLLASRTLLGKILGALGGILVAWQGLGAWALIVQALIMELVSLLMLMRDDRRPLPLTFDRAWLTGMVIAGLPIAINTLCGQLLQRGASVVLGLVAGVQAVGQFNFALRIVELPRTAVYNGLASYALPAFARRADQPGQLASLFAAVTSLTGFLLTPCYIGLALTAEDLVLLVFGEKWLAAVPTLQLLAIMAAVANTALHAQSLLVAVNRIQSVVRAEVVTTLLALGLLGLLGEPLGALAGGLAMLGRMLMIMPVHIAALRRSIGFGAREWLQANHRSLLASLVMSLVVLYCSAHSGLVGYGHWLLDIGVGALSYALAYSLLHPRWWPEFKGMLAMR